MIDDALDRAEKAVADGRGVDRTGFWPAVSRVRRSRELAERYADRIASIDRRAFEAGVKLRAPAAAGAAGLLLGTAAGVAALVVSGRFAGPVRAVIFLAGFGAIDVATHSLAHLLVGLVLGMRFTHLFLGGPPPPRPGAKLDYASYLRTPPRRRAAMHASGAVVTKLVPFALLPLAPDTVSFVVLCVAGAGQIVTDVLLSTKTSDWKKVRRELRAAGAWS